MFNGIAIGIGRTHFAGDFAGSYSSRVVSNGGVTEALECVASVSSLLQSASLLIIPSGYKAGVAYAELPANGNGDLTWSRASSATRTLASGTIETPRTNHIRNSSMVGASTSPSTLPTNWAIAGGGLTGTVVGVGTENGLPYVDVNFSGTATNTDTSIRFESTTQIVASSGQTWANTLYAKLISASSPPLSYNIGFYQRTSTGTFVNIIVTPFTPTSTLTRVSNVVTITDATVARVQPTFIATITNGASYDFTIRIASPQMELSSVATDWIPTTNSARTTFAGITQDGLSASNIPRLDYSQGSCPALLLEPQRTNLVVWSDDFSNAIWTKSASSVTANATTSPDGTANADKLIENTANASHTVFQSITLNTSTSYNFSIYLKSAERFRVRIRFTSFSGANDASVNLNLGTTTAGTLNNVGNGWYRFDWTVNSSTGASIPIVAITLQDSSGNSTYTGDGSSGAFIWGAQLEAGAYSTTYIQTTSATATRLADSFTRNNIYTNGLISASGGTWYVELRNNTNAQRDAFHNSLYIADDTTTLANGFIFAKDGSTTYGVVLRKRIAGVETSIFNTTVGTVKIAIKWNGTTADVFQNGIKVVTATLFTPTNMNVLVGNGNDVPKFIQTMALYPTPISDADCEVLTGTSYSSYSAMATALGYTIL